MWNAQYIVVRFFPPILLFCVVGTASASAPQKLSLRDLKRKMADTRTTWAPVDSEQEVISSSDALVGGLIEEDGAIPAPSKSDSSLGPALKAPVSAPSASPQASATTDGPTIGQGPQELPAAFDWRNQGGQYFLPPVLTKQGACGSCVSFAAMAALEAQLNIDCNTPNRSFDLSRQYFFSCGGGSCRQGWKLSSAMDFLGKSGVTDAGCMPYQAEDGQDVACSAACSDAPRRLLAGIASTQITTGIIDVAAIKRGIQHGPLVANMILFEDLKFYDHGVYRHVSGNQLGTHAIVLIGWDDAQKSWLARNSWGEGWGDHGYFAVAWDDAASLPGRYTWSLDTEHAVQSGICGAFPR